MKRHASLLLAIILAFTAVINASAQSAETIWLAAGNTAYKTGETVLVTVNAISASQIQGFTFQIRYDPACLQPTNAASPVPGMNGLQLPQTPGLVDASYASTTPQTVNGVLAEVRFVTLGECQTDLALESAALAIRNEAGFAAPLEGVTIGERTISLNIAREIGVSPTQEVSGAPLILGEAPPPPSSAIPSWLVILLSAILGGGAIFWFFRLLRKGKNPAVSKAAPSRAATLQINGGPHAGKIFRLRKLPCRIGRDPRNELCFEDPFISSQHARIFVENNGYYLADLGGGTFINEMAVNKSIAALRTGDRVRLGRNVTFTFAA